MQLEKCDKGNGQTIPFLSRAQPDEIAQWCAALSLALHPHSVVPLAELRSDKTKTARVAIVANPDPVELAALPNLVWVQSLWAGVEGLLGTVPEHIGIARLVDPNLAQTMAEAVLAWTLYLHRDMPGYIRQQAEGVWHQLDYRPAPDVRVGLLGLGELGRASAALLSRHGYRTMGWARTPREIEGVEVFHGKDGLTAMLSQTDIAVVLLPLTSTTRDLIGQELLARMPKNAGLINFGRGSVVQTDALVDALNKDRLSHAVLDVFDEEPLAPQSALWRHSKVTVLPHISAPTGRTSAARIAAQSVKTFFETGQTPALVDRTRGY